MDRLKIDHNKYQVLKLPNPMFLHWIFNPGLAFNELFLGQRIPSVLLYDQTSSGSVAERSYTPCPHCGAIHSSMTWSGFGHWMGYVCPACQGVIPCLRNKTSLLILLLVSPIRRPIVNLFGLEKWWLKVELQRIKKREAFVTLPPKKPGWVFVLFVGTFGWGLSFWILFSATFSALFYPIAGFHFSPVLRFVAICLLGGFAWAVSMKLFLIFMERVKKP